MSSKSVIPNGTTYQDFRERCEDRNGLKKQGDLYIGTGDSHINELGGEVYETSILSTPTIQNKRYFLTSFNSIVNWEGLPPKDIIDIIYPIGSAYICRFSDSPNSNTNFVETKWVLAGRLNFSGSQVSGLQVWVRVK